MKAPFAVTLAIATGAAMADSANYLIEPTHTAVIFEVSHLGLSTLRGRFDRKEGTVELDRAGRSGRVELTLQMPSVNTGIAAFDQQLRGKDFFNTDQFPTARFVGERFGFDGDKLSEVAGTLTLLGRSQLVTLKATNFSCYLNPLFKREVCGGDFEATVQRSQWGLDQGLPALAPDSVRLLVQVEAIRQ